MVAEDLGFVGGVVMLVLFGLLVWRILLIGWQARDAFGMMIAVGLASMILFQVLVNVGMVIGVMPVTGIPLPFVTYGGSSLISLLFGHGHPPVDPDASAQADALIGPACVLRGSLAERASDCPPGVRRGRLGLRWLSDGGSGGGSSSGGAGRTPWRASSKAKTGGWPPKRWKPYR